MTRPTESSETAELAALYRRYGPLVLRRCRMLLRNQGDAEDAMQEVFLKVVQHWDEFRQEASPSTWIYRISTNHCLNRLRTAGRQEELDERLIEHIAQTPEDTVGSREALQKLLARCDARAVEVLVYRYVDGLSLSEVASTVGLARNTVASVLKQVQKRLTRLVVA